MPNGIKKPEREEQNVVMRTRRVEIWQKKWKCCSAFIFHARKKQPKNPVGGKNVESSPRILKLLSKVRETLSRFWGLRRSGVVLAIHQNRDGDEASEVFFKTSWCDKSSFDLLHPPHHETQKTFSSSLMKNSTTSRKVLTRRLDSDSKTDFKVNLCALCFFEHQNLLSFTRYRTPNRSS